MYIPQCDTLLSDLGLITGVEKAQVAPKRALINDYYTNQLEDQEVTNQ